MASDYIFIQGKCKWPKFVTPDLKYKCWSVVLYPNSESYNKILELKNKNGETDGILNVIKKDEDGYNITIKKKTERLMKGTLVGQDPPEVLGPDNLPLRNALVGNGSDITVKLRVYKYKKPTGGFGTAIELYSVRVDNLVPYEMRRDQTDTQEKLTRDLADQKPQPLF